MRRAILSWLAAVVIAALVGAGAVIALNATVFGAGGFVSIYLDALARGDVSDALTLPGVDTRGVDTLLLQDGTLAGLADIHQVSDEERGGAHWVTVAWTTPHGSSTTTFEVHRIGTRFGLFPQWGFAVSPLATVSLSVTNDARFTVNGVQETATAHSDKAVEYAVLVPGSYTFGHSSALLKAASHSVIADTVGQNLSAIVQPEANGRFTAAVTAEVRRQLDACAQQTVLFPTGCSFGQSIQNRVSGAPEWTIEHYPAIRIAPGSDFGSWAIPSTPGTAHLKVAVTSLLDGSVSAFDQDVPFQLRATIAIDANNAVSVVQR
ncbi:MAG TPA: hypothetical protein VGM38_00475 [Pseudolysinimonas sp.]|jgi:hypothetical protein